MERKTIKIKTKESGIEVEYKSFITGGEMREITNIFLGDAEVSLGAKGTTSMNSIKANVMVEAQDKTFEMMIVSIGGKTENVVEEMKKLPLKDFDEIAKVLTEMTSPKEESDTSKV